ncbi:hypothetical protein QM012_008725 [Aureobasidium pullulans]|uniref:SRR1-like domain-containing protein n=1 Tax=Aureobasidium pullulans TaxID=5580 RepID=A0ABR0TIY6_AURPU
MCQTKNAYSTLDDDMGGIVTSVVEPSQTKLETALGHKVSSKVFDALCSKYANPSPAIHDDLQIRGQTELQNDERNGRPNVVHFQRPTGQARNPQTLLKVSQDIEGTLQEIKEEPEWQGLRDQIQAIVNQMINVQTMICLGLGNWAPRESFQRTNCFVVQYAVFKYMCEKVDENWRNKCASRGTNYEPLERYFQDPAFDEQTKYLLQGVSRPSDPSTNIVIVDPAAANMIRNNKNVFVFAPHLNCNIWPEILSLLPQVFIGNSPNGFGGRDVAAIETYVRECKVIGSDDVGPRFNDLQAIFRETDTMYRQSYLEQGPVDPSHLADLTIYQLSK